LSAEHFGEPGKEFDEIRRHRLLFVIIGVSEEVDGNGLLQVDIDRVLGLLVGNPVDDAFNVDVGLVRQPVADESPAGSIIASPFPIAIS
jgi:hypothetical protein